MSQRDRIKLSKDEIAEFLQRSRVLMLTSNGKDGYPHPMPMFYGLEDDGAIVMTTYTKSQKILNLRRDPRVSLLIEDGANYFELRGVVFYGTAELVDDTDEVGRFLGRVATRQGAPADDSAEAVAGRRKTAEKRTGIRVRAERIVSWDHRKLAGGG
jgi:PPOX class probable F420-dependent enzyme